MQHIIVIICQDCHHYNQLYLGTEKFQPRETNFTSFSDAWTHMVANPTHWMSMDVREETEDD